MIEAIIFGFYRLILLKFLRLFSIAINLKTKNVIQIDFN